MNEVRIRNYRERDLEPLVELINAADAVDQLEWGTSLQELQERFALPTLKPEENVFVAQAGGQIVGYTRLRLEKGEAESVFKTDGVVHPEWRRRGIGRSLLRRAHRRAEERLGEVVSETVYFDTDCESGEAGRMALFESFGMRPARYFLEMAYAPLEDIPEPQFPPGIAVRTWVRGQDDEATLAAFNEAFADHWDFIPEPLEDWLHWVNLPRFRPELNLLAVVGEEIAGLCLCDVNKEHIARIGRKEGWVDILGVRRPYRHQGLGRALLLAGLHVLKEAGMESATLGVDAESLTGATRLYESVGFVERKRYILYRRPL
ncbi:MAG: GNAT family N-acetyltransferase [Anaerolineae bacterium]